MRRLAMVLCCCLASAVAGATARAASPDGILAPLRAGFVGNAGQRDARSLFLWRGESLAAHVTAEGLRLVLAGAPEGAAVFLSFEDARGGPLPARTVEGLEPLAGRLAVYRGRSAFPDVPRNGSVAWRGVSRGVDVVARTTPRGLEYDLLLAPGADPADLVLRCAGAEGLEVDGEGRLRIETRAGTLVQSIPAAWQVDEQGRRQPLAARFERLDEERFGLRAEGRDPRRPLVIDPDLTYSSFLGGQNFDTAFDVAVGPDGLATVTGRTASIDFPTTPGAFDSTVEGISDVFVARIDLDAGTLAWSTLLGGDDQLALQGERGTAVAVDADGRAWVTGWANSADFPTTAGAFQETPAGAADGFVAELDDDGTLLWSTLLGGSRDDLPADIAAAPGGGAVVVGHTFSGISVGDVAFPTTPGAFDETHNSTIVFFADGFVTRVAADGASLTWSTFLGGLSRDEAAAVAVAADGVVTVAGVTGSSGFPVTTGSFDETFNGATQSDTDAFVTRLAADGASLVWSGYIGGSGDAEAHAVAIDAAGAAYVAGDAATGDLPVTLGAFDGTHEPGGTFGTDAWVGKVAADGSALAWLTYLGGADDDVAEAIAADAVGAVTVAGSTRSADFPVPGGTPTIDAVHGGLNDAFVVRLDAAGGKLVFSTFHGGTDDELAHGLALDRFGAAVVVGETRSSGMVTTANAHDPTYGGDVDGFVARMGVPPWIDVGHSKAGTGGLHPFMIGTGSLEPASPGNVVLGDALPNSFAVLFVGFVNDPVLFEGGLLVPFPFATMIILNTGPAGTITLPWASWPPALPPGFNIYLHTAVSDPGAAYNVAMSNALETTNPP